MSIVRQCRRVMQRILLGDTLFPQEFFLGLREPQKEVTVWFHGMGTAARRNLPSFNGMRRTAYLMHCIG